MLRVGKLFGSLLFILVLAATAAIVPTEAPASVVTTGDVMPAWDPLAPWDATTDVFVGRDVGPGEVMVDVSDGPTAVVSAGVNIAKFSTSPGTVTVTGTGATWDTNGYISIGTNLATSGILNILNGGSMSTAANSDASVSVGASGGTGVLAVDGAGSLFNFQGTYAGTGSSTLYLGTSGGTGTMNISNGGAVNVASAVYVADFAANSAGSINFGAGGGTLTTGSLYATPSDLTGTGTINTNGIVSDINVTFASAGDLLGRTLPGFSGPTVNLNPISTSGNTASYGQLGAGYEGTGSLLISNGLTLNTLAGYVGVKPGSSGTATIDGAGSMWTTATAGTSFPSLVVGEQGNGVLVIENGGGFSTAGHIMIGHWTGGTGAATVTGAGSTLATTFSLSVGYSGSGTLSIGNGAAVTTRNTYIGDTSEGSGVVTLDHATWANTQGPFYVGQFGNGTLHIQNGGVLTTTSLSFTQIGSGPYGSGEASEVTVDGAGSKWVNNSTSQNFVIGGRGGATLSITNGGLVTSKNPVLISKFYGGTGTVLVDGTGSTMTVTNKVVYVGSDGVGSLSITNGGYVNTSSSTSHVYVGGCGTTSYIAPTNSAVGSLTVDGAGSRLVAGTAATGTIANLYVGYNGLGSLNISNGGSVTNFYCYIGGDNLITSPDLRTSGTATISGAASTWTNRNTLHVGYRKLGTVNLDGGTILANSIIGGSASGTMTFNFNGGTLKPYATPAATWISRVSGTSNLYVLEGGAKLDTNGYSTAIALPLQHGGSSATDGGLTKLGLGTLTLSGSNTYTGWTTVSGGALSLAWAGLYDASNVRVDTGTTLNLSFSGPDTVHWLFLGGLAQAAGTYDVSNSGGYITGSGSLFVSAAALQGDADLNGTVNSTDLGLLLSHYNQVGTGFAWGLGDFDANGTINSTDLGLLLSHYNQVSAATSAVPEPSTLLLLAAGLIGLLAYAWRKK